MKLRFPFISALSMLAFIIIEPTPYLLLMMGAAALHEAGHLVAMHACGVSVSRVTILPIGIDIKKQEKLLPYSKEILISASGAAINFLLFFIFFKPLPFFAYFNLLYGSFNLLPVKGLDGGEVVLCIFSALFSRDTAERVLKITSFIFCILLWMTGIYILFILNGNLSIFALAVFLFVSEIMKSPKVS